nr:HupE/UreJ family protein [uncultured Roseateles sp.]
MKRIFTLAFALLLLPMLASAHSGEPGHGHSLALLDGFLHPFSGADHLAAMLAVGLWSGLAMRRLWLAPLSFAALLLVGALSGWGGSLVEPMVAASVLVLGLLAAFRLQLPAAAAATLVGGFAFFHGMAHGAELGAGQALLGMVLATALLHAAGLLIGLQLRRLPAVGSRLLGGGIALLGLGLLARMVAA